LVGRSNKKLHRGLCEIIRADSLVHSTGMTAVYLNARRFLRLRLRLAHSWPSVRIVDLTNRSEPTFENIKPGSIKKKHPF
jgi:hypothetical protein